MKFPKFILAAAAIMLFACAPAARAVSPVAGAPTSNTAASPFLGRWDLTLKAPDHEWPSWIEITEEDGQLKAQIHRPLGQRASSSQGRRIGRQAHLRLSERRRRQQRPTWSSKASSPAKSLTGTVNGPDGTTWHWVGDRAPALVYTRAPHWGKPVHALQRQRPHRVASRQARRARVDSARTAPSSAPATAMSSSTITSSRTSSSTSNSTAARMRTAASFCAAVMKCR